jgi:hypothetical protein
MQNVYSSTKFFSKIKQDDHNNISRHAEPIKYAVGKLTCEFSQIFVTL